MIRVSQLDVLDVQKKCLQQKIYPLKVTKCKKNNITLDISYTNSGFFFLCKLFIKMCILELLIYILYFIFKLLCILFIKVYHSFVFHYNFTHTQKKQTNGQWEKNVQFSSICECVPISNFRMNCVASIWNDYTAASCRYWTAIGTYMNPIWRKNIIFFWLSFVLCRVRRLSSEKCK